MSDELKLCKLEETESYECRRFDTADPKLYATRLTVHVLECSECGRTCEHVNGTYPRCPYCSSVNMLDENYEPQVIQNAEKYKLADDSGAKTIQKAVSSLEDSTEDTQVLTDSREKLNEELMDSCLTFANGGGHLRAFAYVSDLLDRQAAITEREVKLRELYRFEENHREHIRSIEEASQRLNDRIAELTAELETYRKYAEQGEREELQPVESGDTREELEADLQAILRSAYMLAWMHGNENRRGSSFEKLHAEFYNLLDRQAAITTAECTSEDESCCEACRAAQKRETAKLTAERDMWKMKCETREIAYKQADAERKRYSEQIDELTAERDQLSHDLDAEHALVVQFEYDNEALKAERGKLEKELKQARIEWESERDYADQCEERLMELTGETYREEKGMTKKQLKKDYKRLLKQIDELDERIDKERLDTEDYRLMRAMYFAMCAIEGLLRHRIETM